MQCSLQSEFVELMEIILKFLGSTREKIMDLTRALSNDNILLNHNTHF